MTDMLIRRETEMTPGYDCMHAECTHDTKGDHGIHGDEFLHAVITEAPDGRLAALVIMIFTNRYPSTVPEWRRDRSKPSSAVDLTLHIQGAKPEADRQYSRGLCSWTGNTLCQTERSTALGASELWKALAIEDQNPEKPGEAFWQAMEERLRRHLADPTLFKQPEELWELTHAREMLVKARKAYQEAGEELNRCEKSFRHFAAKHQDMTSRSTLRRSKGSSTPYEVEAEPPMDSRDG